MLILAAAAACCILSGHIRAASGAPIPGATVSVISRSGTTSRVSTDSAGGFSLHVDPGKYDIEAIARGYVVTDVASLSIDRDDVVEVRLEPVDTPNLRVIGSVEVNGAAVPSRAVIPTVTISRAEMDKAGNDRLIQSLATVPSVTFARPDGGNDASPALVALRGPDPSETLIALDGQILNDGNTGDLDLVRFPVAAFSSVAVTEGLGPSDREGSNTIGGAVNIIGLRPTVDTHTAYSLSLGSFGTSEMWFNTTGTRRRLGYAVALDDQQEHGYVDQNDLLCTAGAPADPCNTTTPIHLGSSVSSRAALANVTWNFSPAADLGVRVFTMGNNRDLSASSNTPFDPVTGGANPSQEGSNSFFIGPGPATFAQTIRAYALKGRSPLGAGTLVYSGALSNNDVDFNGTGLSPYDITNRDKRSTISLSWERVNADSELAFGGYNEQETLTEEGVAGNLAQSIHAYFVRGSIEPAKRLRLQGGVYLSQYSTFGSNLDGRFGVSYDFSPNDVARASIGTGFRPPLLIERYVFDPADLPQDQNCVALGQGNPELQPEHATEYELGYAHRFSPNTNLDVALYQTNLRNPIENFYPLGARCPATSPPAQSFPINIGNVVYQGAEISLSRRMPHILLNARYGLNVAYPFNLPASVSNPTSGGNLVAYQQFLNIPQQQGAVGIAYDNADWHAALETYVRGNNNELNQGAFAVLNAAVGVRAGNADFTLAGTNLTSAVSGPFTLPGFGVPYRGLVQQPDGSTAFGSLPTDALFLQPIGIRLIVTVRN